jgi:imidazolonepropionase
LTLRGPAGVRRGAALHDLGLIEDGSVLIKDGVIAAVGTTRRIENLKEARAALEVPVGDAVIMPGFIDPNLQLGIGGAENTPERISKRRVMADFFEDTLSLMRSCAQYGTLTVGVKAESRAVDVRSILALFRQLAQIGNNPVRMVRMWRLLDPPAAEEELGEVLRSVLPQVLQRNLAAGLEPSLRRDRSVNPDLWSAAAAAGGIIKLSWAGDGLPDHLQDVVAASGARVICTSPVLTAAECNILTALPIMAVVCSGRETLERDPGPSVRQFVDAGAPFALSSGYHFTDAPTFSMQMVIALAVFRLGLTVEQAIVAATINAAYAVGCADQVGSLELGKRADVIVLNVPDYREIPRRFGINHVAIAIRDGNVLFNRMRASR